MSRRAPLERRVQVLEQEQHIGPLSPAERVELDRLQAESDLYFAGPIATWSDAVIEDFIRGESAGGRLHDLRARNAGDLEQQAADRRRLAAHLGIPEGQLADFTADAVRQLTVNRRDDGPTHQPRD